MLIAVVVQSPRVAVWSAAGYDESANGIDDRSLSGRALVALGPTRTTVPGASGECGIHCVFPGRGERLPGARRVTPASSRTLRIVL